MPMRHHVPVHAGGRGLTRLPTIDGLRGLGMIAIISFHAGLLPGGYLSIDLFFVVSGYLITRLLLASSMPPTGGSLASFWAMRARRLLPLLTLFLGVVLVAAPSLSDAADLTDLSDRALGAAAFVGNWQAISSDGYWQAFGEGSPLEHVWSLAVEEQVYVLLPLLLAVLARVRRPVESLAAVALGGAAASMAWAVVLFEQTGDLDRVYLGTDTRAAALLLGVAVAAIEVRRSRDGLAALVPPMPLVAAAMVGMAASWVLLLGEDPFLWRGGMALHTTAAAIVVCALVAPAEVSPALALLRRAMSWGPLVQVGILSYALYLWHWPLFLWLDEDATDLSGVPLGVARVAILVPLAWLSHVLVEQPTRRLRIPPVRWLLAVPASLAIVVAAVAVAPAPPPPIAEAGEQLSVPSSGRLLVIGDSVGASLVPGIAAVRRVDEPVVESRAIPFCHFHPITTQYVLLDGTFPAKDCTDGKSFIDVAVEGLTANGPADVLVLFGNPVLDSTPVGEDLADFCAPDMLALRTGPLEELVERTAPQRVLLLTTPRLLVENHSLGATTQLEVDERLACHQRAIDEVAAAHPDRVAVIDLAGWLCPDGECTEVIDGVELRPDGLHYTEQGARPVARWVLDQVAALGGGDGEEPAG